MEFIFQELRHRPNAESVAIAVRPNSARMTQIIDLYTTQSALLERAKTFGHDTWGDDETIAEAQAQLATTGDTLVLETSDRIAGEPPLLVSVPALPAAVVSVAPPATPVPDPAVEAVLQ